MDKDFGFIIPSYCDSDLHLAQLKRCIKSIIGFHPKNNIIVIDDHSKVNLTKSLSEFKNVKVVISPVKGAGDMVTYDVFRNNHDFQKAVIFQDSMTLEKKLEDIDEIDDINYIWYFTNHRLHWHKIPEPKNEYNIANNINVHDDAVLDAINKLIKKSDFKSYALEKYHKKNEWSGCFGCLGIVDYEFVSELNKKTGIVDILMNFNNNRTRRVAESIFALACQFVLGDKVFEKAYDGLYFDGVNSPRNRKFMNASDIGLNFNVRVDQVCKNIYFSKVSFNRNA